MKGPRRSERDNPLLDDFVEQLKAYFNGTLQTFSVAIDLQVPGFTAEVLGAARKIKYGQTMTYGQLAERIGRPNACRAVGNALGANPLPLVIPCHRVIAANGQLGGFSAGLQIKRQLLEHEKAHRPR